MHGFSRFKLLTSVVVAGLMFPLLVNAQDGAPVLPLQSVLQKAYDTNPTLLAERATLRSVEERLPQAWANFKPDIVARGGITSAEQSGSSFNATAGGVGAGTSATGTTSKDISISLTQPVFRGGRSIAQLEAARAIVEAQKASLLQVEQDVLYRTASAYMDVLRDQALVDLNSNNRDVISRQLEATQQRFDVGELSLTDVSQAKSRFAAVEADIIAANGSLRTTRAVFEELVGEMPDNLAQPAIFLDLPQSKEDALIVAERSNPLALAAMFAQKAAESDVDNVFGEMLPEVGFTAEWARTYDPQPGIIPEQTNKSVSLNATIPLYQGGAVRSRVREAKEIALQRMNEISEAQRSARQKAIASWEQIEAARALIEARNAQIKAAGIAREGVRLEEEVGERSILDMLDAEQEYLQAQVDLVGAQRNETVARFSLAAVLGMLTPQNLGFTDNAAEHNVHSDIIKERILNSDVDSLPNNN